MKNRALSPYKWFTSLTEARKEAVYRECDDENSASNVKPLTPEMRKLWNRAKRKGGRPKIGRGCTPRARLNARRG